MEKIDGQAFHINVNEMLLFERNYIKAIDNLAFIGKNKPNNAYFCFVHAFYSFSFANEFTDSLCRSLPILDIGVGDIFNRTSVQKMWFTFQSNTLETMAIPFDWHIPGVFQFRLIDLKVLTPIRCDDALQLHSNHLLSQFSDSVYFRVGSDLTMYSLATILTKTCTTYSPVTITIISISAVVMLIFALVAAVLLYRLGNKCRAKREIPVIMPEGKTYRETQIVMQIEHAGLLKTDL